MRVSTYSHFKKYLFAGFYFIIIFVLVILTIQLRATELQSNICSINSKIDGTPHMFSLADFETTVYFSRNIT